MTYPLIQVALGGAIGASLRFLLGAQFGRPGFPVAVLSANIVGSFLMGLLVIWLSSRGLKGWEPFLLTGVLGGFTTFSAFSLETITLFERGQVGQAALYVGLSVGGAIGALAMGIWLARTLA
ncbi:MAG: fluoride efflux transporter CrcB [Pseudomonadota bacterium]